MRVQFFFKDNIDTYEVEAEVSGSNIQILQIVDSYGTDVDFDDFSQDEKKLIRGLALNARTVLESQELDEDWNNDDETEEFIGY